MIAYPTKKAPQALLSKTSNNLIMEIYFILIGFGATIVFLFYLFFRSTADEKKNEERVKRSLEDERIYDPETGKYLTLEQAESDECFLEENSNRLISKREIDAHFHEDEVRVVNCFNWINKKSHQEYTFNDTELEVLETIKILNTYESWSYTECSIISDKAFLFFPSVEYSLDNPNLETQIMIWHKLKGMHGHHIFKPESIVDKVLDVIKNDDTLELKGFEPNTFTLSPSPMLTIIALQKLEGLKNVNIEVLDNNLFIKTNRIARLEDLKMLHNYLTETIRDLSYE